MREFKTPEQIAAQIESGIYSDDDNYLLTREEMHEHLVAAIEADRAQRESVNEAFVRQNGPDLTDEQIARVADAIQWSSIPEALDEIAFSVTGPEIGDNA